MTEEEKARHKEFRDGHKAYVKTGKEIAKQAKKEGRHGVHAVYIGGGYGEHGEKALKAAQNGWKSTKNLQQFTHAEVK